MNDLSSDNPSAQALTTAQPRSRERRGSRQPPKQQSRAQRVSSIACVVVALALLVPAAQMALAGLASYRVELALQRWAEQGKAPLEQPWLSALTAAQRANSLYPVASGTYLDQLGQVQAWRFFDQPAGADSARQSRQAAAQAYRQATVARPTWPNTWAHLAQSKFALGELDSEFTQALEQANLKGPYRPDVQLELASIGLRAWPLLTHSQRVDAITSARLAMDSTNEAANSLFALAQATSLEQTLCMGVANDSDRVRNICTRGGNR